MEHTQMELREVKGPIKQQSEGSPWRYMTTTLHDHTLSSIAACHLEMVLIEANAVKHTLAECGVSWEDRPSYQARRRSMNHRVHTSLPT